MITSSDKFDNTTNTLSLYDYRCDWHLLLHQVTPSSVSLFSICGEHMSQFSINLYKTYRRQKFGGIYPTAVLSRGMESTTHIGPKKKYDSSEHPSSHRSEQVLQRKAQHRCCNALNHPKIHVKLKHLFYFFSIRNAGFTTWHWHQHIHKVSSFVSEQSSAFVWGTTRQQLELERGTDLLATHSTAQGLAPFWGCPAQPGSMKLYGLNVPMNLVFHTNTYAYSA